MGSVQIIANATIITCNAGMDVLEVAREVIENNGVKLLINSFLVQVAFAKLKGFARSTFIGEFDHFRAQVDSEPS